MNLNKCHLWIQPTVSNRIKFICRWGFQSKHNRNSQVLQNKNQFVLSQNLPWIFLQLQKYLDKSFSIFSFHSLLILPLLNEAWKLNSEFHKRTVLLEISRLNRSRKDKDPKGKTIYYRFEGLSDSMTFYWEV